MGRRHSHRASAAAPHQRHGFGDRACRLDQFVHQDGIQTRHLADNGERLGVTVARRAPFFHKGERRIKSLRKVARFFRESQIGGHNDRVVELDFLNIIHQDRQRAKLVARDIEESLDLTGVQINRDVAVCAGGDNQIGDQACGDGHARLIFFVAAPVGIVWQNRRDPSRRGALERIEKNQELDEVAVNGRTQPLYQKNISPTDAALELYKDIFIREIVDVRFRKLETQMLANLECERTISPPAKYERFAVRTQLVHGCLVSGGTVQPVITWTAPPLVGTMRVTRLTVPGS